MNRNYRSFHFRKQDEPRDPPPTVPQPSASPAPYNAEDRLREIKSLFDRGLISKKEYERKRADILNAI